MTDLYHSSSGTHGMSTEAHECPVCHRLSYWFINTGWTRCVGCKLDEELKEGRR